MISHTISYTIFYPISDMICDSPFIKQYGLFPPADIDNADIITGSEHIPQNFLYTKKTAFYTKNLMCVRVTCSTWWNWGQIYLLRTMRHWMIVIASRENKSSRNDSVSCDLGLCYPLLQSIFARMKNHQSSKVNSCCIQYRIWHWTLDWALYTK